MISKVQSNMVALNKANNNLTFLSHNSARAKLVEKQRTMHTQ